MLEVLVEIYFVVITELPHVTDTGYHLPKFTRYPVRQSKASLLMSWRFLYVLSYICDLVEPVQASGPGVNKPDT